MRKLPYSLHRVASEKAAVVDSSSGASVLSMFVLFCPFGAQKGGKLYLTGTREDKGNASGHVRTIWETTPCRAPPPI